MLVLARIMCNLRHLRLGDFVREQAALALAFRVHLEHDPRRRVAGHREKPFKHLDDEVLSEALERRLGSPGRLQSLPLTLRAIQPSCELLQLLLDPFAPAQLATLPFDEAGDLKKWRSGLNEIEKAGKAAHVAILFVYCALAERDRDAAERALAIVPAEGAVNPYDNSLVPRPFFVALVAHTFGEKEKAQAAFMETRAAAQNKMSGQFP
jgi:hypothetical protein